LHLNRGEKMKLMLKLAPAFLASALLMAPASLTPAAAAPMGSAKSLGVTLDPLVEVQHRRDGRRHHQSRRYHQGRRHYAPPRRYHRGPPGYRRYGSRPYNWQRRGCVMVGPVWFCP
jgi:hypothetical protein